MIVVMVAMCITDMHKPTYETGHRPMGSRLTHVTGIDMQGWKQWANSEYNLSFVVVLWQCHVLFGNQ